MCRSRTSSNKFDAKERGRSVMERLHDAGLTVKLKKCQFGMDHCVYLGHVVGSEEVSPEPTKLAAVKTFPVPRPKKCEYFWD